MLQDIVERFLQEALAPNKELMYMQHLVDNGLKEKDPQYYYEIIKNDKYQKYVKQQQAEKEREKQSNIKKKKKKKKKTEKK